ncbi:tRNA preQ1(34) S-adenosylmethionine ribosyltransferase-isomerase QueA [Helicobacter cetorum]|uniref:tRNA preQ1(34) S-adenosylmethionine ribosyltransferase-isomerase QueA n=1 Tax=Helicobacter cetorum TaxID=138563 RepID=UPI000CF09D5F|nr:tRNA preQ1(34) S-adenosylmethionine ribosyltransferase-isomerase QueA [Helicobacter cetorum]
MREFDLESYDYNLPKELIANYPILPKEKAKLLVYERHSQKITHTTFEHVLDFFPKNALVVLNDTRVIKARLFGAKHAFSHLKTTEVFFHRFIKDNIALTQIKGKVKVGTKIFFDANSYAEVLELLVNGQRLIAFYENNNPLEEASILSLLEQHGHMPLPPYIKRADESLDLNEYQSVFAKHSGAIAAPTASLHFSKNCLETLQKNFKHTFLTLHVGAGTFVNVETKDIREHKIHTEILQISKESQKILQNSKEILCVGTTALRSVEYFKRLENPKQETFECDIFLHLANPIKHVNYLLTNFHLPKSSLLMLVSALIGLEKAKEIYSIAIENKYRFYSYGDGMLIL